MWRIRIWLRYTLPRLLRQFFGWVGRGFKPVPPYVFHDIREFITHGFDWPDKDPATSEEWKRLERWASNQLYKATSCGAWLVFVSTPPEPDYEVRQFEAHLSQKNGPLGVVGVWEVKGQEKLHLGEILEWPAEVCQYLSLSAAPGFEHGFQPLESYRLETLFDAQGMPASDWTPIGVDEVRVKFRCSIPKPRTLPTPLGGIWGIQVGSIVEGADACADTDPLYFPFNEKEYDDTVQSVEDQCQEIWNDTHGCAHCWTATVCPEEGDCPQCDDPKGTPGDGSVDPDCKSCSGDGVAC